MSVTILSCGEHTEVESQAHLKSLLEDKFKGKHVSVVAPYPSGAKAIHFISVSEKGDISGTYGHVDINDVRFDG
jgi:hypothetical protein